MSKKAREKPTEAGSASVSPYGSVLGYELVRSQPNRLINLIWPECRTWFIGPWSWIFFVARASELRVFKYLAKNNYYPQISSCLFPLEMMQILQLKVDCHFWLCPHFGQ